MIAQFDTGAASDVHGRRRDQRRREAVACFVGANLARRDLCADDIVHATGVSRSALYRLLEKQGGVTRFIQDRRLSALRDALDRGGADRLSDLAERFGFADEAHMRRLFVAAHGVSPAAYRDEMRAAEANEALTGYRKWKGWMRDLA